MKPFDFNGDGKVDPVEQAIAFKLVSDLEEVNRKDSEFNNKFKSEAHSWIIGIVAGFALFMIYGSLLVAIIDLFDGGKFTFFDDNPIGVICVIIAVISIIIGIIALLVAICQKPKQSEFKPKETKNNLVTDSVLDEKEQQVANLCSELNSVIEQKENETKPKETQSSPLRTTGLIIVIVSLIIGFGFDMQIIGTVLLFFGIWLASKK